MNKDLHNLPLILAFSLKDEFFWCSILMTWPFSLPVSHALDQEIKSLQKSFNLTDEGESSKAYLGTRFIK